MNGNVKEKTKILDWKVIFLFGGHLKTYKRRIPPTKNRDRELERKHKMIRRAIQEFPYITLTFQRKEN